MFEKYQHIERFGTKAVDNINIGTCHIFPKIDGTNSSLWVEDGIIHAGSRKRELTLDNDNADFFSSIKDDDRIKAFFKDYPNLRLYGEWLVPHTLKNYKDDAWNKFYVFDVISNNIIVQNDNINSRYLPYEEYSKILDKYGIDYIPLIKSIENPSYNDIIACLNEIDFLTTDGNGEGIVIKNYKYRNCYNRQTWAKIVKAEFQSVHNKKTSNGNNKKSFSKNIVGSVEPYIVENFVTDAFIEKEYSKIIAENPDIEDKKLSNRLLGRVWHELIVEESYNIIKKYKNPVIDFKLLKSLVTNKIMQVKQDLF